MRATASTYEVPEKLGEGAITVVVNFQPLDRGNIAPLVSATLACFSAASAAQRPRTSNRTVSPSRVGYCT